MMGGLKRGLKLGAVSWFLFAEVCRNDGWPEARIETYQWKPRQVTAIIVGMMGGLKRGLKQVGNLLLQY